MVGVAPNLEHDFLQHIIGVGLSFPHSDSAATVEYVIGTVGQGAAT